MTNKENLIISGSIGLAATAYNSLRLWYFYNNESEFPSANYKYFKAKQRVLLDPMYQTITFLGCSAVPFLLTQIISQFVNLAAEMPIILSSPLKKLPRALFSDTKIAPALSQIIRDSSTGLQCAGFACCIALVLYGCADKFHQEFLGNTNIDIVGEISANPKIAKIEWNTFLANLAISSVLACGMAYYDKLAR